MHRSAYLTLVFQTRKLYFNSRVRATSGMQSRSALVLTSACSVCACRSATSIPLVQLHFALMSFVLNEEVSEEDEVSVRLSKDVQRPWYLDWQELVADFLAWAECDESAAIRALRSVEYHVMSPAHRLLVLRLLCGRAADQPSVRAAVDRRADWALAQGWDWEAATLLGRIQCRLHTSQLARVEPLGHDRHGRTYHWLQGRVWVLSDTECNAISTTAAIRKFVQTLAKAHGCAEQQLRFTLERMLKDRVLESAAHNRDDSTFSPTALPRPKYEKVLGCAVACSISGSTVRLFVLDLLRHVQVRASTLGRQHTRARLL
jgi:hypothetical protein